MTIGISYTNEEIVNEFADMVYRLAVSRVKNAVDADDVFQEVFLRFVKSKKQFESKDHIRFWLIRVTINCSKDYWKSRDDRRTEPLEKAELQQAGLDDANGIDVNSLIASLPPKMRLIMHLFYIEDLPTDAIGHIMKIRQSTVTSQLCMARKILRERLGDDSYDQF